MSTTCTKNKRMRKALNQRIRNRQKRPVAPLGVALRKRFVDIFTLSDFLFMRTTRNIIATIFFLGLPAVLVSCGGGGGGRSGESDSFFISPHGVETLSAGEVTDVVSRAVQASLDRNQLSTIAVTDRVGNVLAIYQMTNAAPNATITSGLNPNAVAGLDGFTVPSTLAAIAKAITGAYLSSTGNAFTTRTASQIVQEFFQPGEVGQPSGPLYGVQFSQLPCSDLNLWLSQHPTIGPKRSPLGLSADPGGFPIYKNGRVVGGIGVIASSANNVNAIYGLDRNIQIVETDLDEEIAYAALPAALRPPQSIQANQIVVNGQSFQFSNSTPGTAAAANVATQGAFVALAGYKAVANPISGTSYGDPASGYAASAVPAFAGLNAFNLVTDTAAVRYPATAGAGGLAQAEVTTILAEALRVANRTRAAIRNPRGSSPAEVTISMVDLDGSVLGQIRSADAPIFGTDVSLQKARAALAFSSAEGLTDFLNSGNAGNDALVNAMDTFFAERPNVLNGNVAFSARAIGNAHRPYFPDGDVNRPRGPLSTAISETNNNWSPFNVGFQLNIVANQVLGTLGQATRTVVGGNQFAPDASQTCVDPSVAPARQARFANGLQIFPGGFPIYKGDTLVGAIGISGDGIDQDEMIAYLGVINGATVLGNNTLRPFPVNSTKVRADFLSNSGTPLKYVQCPQAPFIGSNANDVCPNQ